MSAITTILCRVGTIFLHLCILFSTAQVPEIHDFIIVGAGTAGCTLANRLSESGKHSVLVLEAGGEPHPDFEVPALAGPHLSDPQYARTYQTVRQQNAGQVLNGTINVVVGRTLGGTSTVNGMVWNRGSPYDMDNWANITKDPSWSYSAMLEYFRKSENYSGDFPSDQHGFSGPVSVSRPKYAPGMEEFLAAGQHLGYSIEDPNGPQKISYTPLEFSKRAGRRASSYSSHLQPFLSSRRNLKVITSAEVVQLIFQGNKATGVRFKKGSQMGGSGISYNLAVAKKEVIVSAGVIESPALLQRSGIGPKEVLKAAGIRQLKELPVGKNLHDHVSTPMTFILNNKTFTFDRNRDLTPANWELFQKTGEGPYSSNSGTVAQAFMYSARSPDNPKWPNLQLYFKNSPTPHPIFGESGHTGPMADWEVPVTCFVFITRPRSRGSVNLNPTNSSGFPVIDFQYFSHPEDMEVVIDAIKAALVTFEQSPSFQKLGARYPSEPLPACRNVVPFRSDDYWRCFIRQVSSFGAHPAGTIRMGSGVEDPEAVVDPKLGVIGIDRLRVVDASIFPAISNANPQAVVYAVAEKAASMILERWTKSN